MPASIFLTFESVYKLFSRFGGLIFSIRTRRINYRRVRVDLFRFVFFCFLQIRFCQKRRKKEKQKRDGKLAMQRRQRKIRLHQCARGRVKVARKKGSLGENQIFSGVFPFFSSLRLLHVRFVRFPTRLPEFSGKFRVAQRSCGLSSLQKFRAPYDKKRSVRCMRVCALPW